MAKQLRRFVCISYYYFSSFYFLFVFWFLFFFSFFLSFNLLIGWHFLSGIVASHSFHCYVTVSSCVLATCSNYCSRGLPTDFFPDIAPSRILSTNSLCLGVCHIHEWRLFFKIFKCKLSSFALWKTISFVILSLHVIFTTLLQHLVSDAFTNLSSFSNRVHVSDP
jgi:hypothetical protein